MHAPHQLAVGDDAAAHAGADEEHRRIAAALQGPGLQLGHGGGLAVVFQQHAAAAFLGQQLAQRRVRIVEQSAAVGQIAGPGIHEARHGHGDAFHLVLMGQIQLV